MEAIGVASSILAIIDLAGKVSVAATSFMRDVKDARQEMIQIRKNLSTLSAILEVIDEDLKNDAPSIGVIQNPHRQIVNIASSCRTVLLEVEDVIGPDRSRVTWVMSGRAQVNRLMGHLVMHITSLELGLDTLSM